MEAGSRAKRMAVIGAVTTRANDRRATETDTDRSDKTDHDHRPETQWMVTGDVTEALETEMIIEKIAVCPQQHRVPPRP